MFSARKLLEPPAKRNNTFLTVPTADTESIPIEVGGKRQRLHQPWTFDQSKTGHTRKKDLQRREPIARALDDIEHDNLLSKSSTCTLIRLCALPAYLIDEMLREKPSHEQLTHCQVSVPTERNEGSTDDEEIVLRSYYILVLHERVVLWQQGTGTVVSLTLPEEIAATDRLHPFLFVLYGSRVSLMIVTSRGSVWFWEDIELPYETLPLSVQIPLQSDERMKTRYDATMVVSDTNKTIQSLLCWSNLGNVWEVAMDDRRIRVRILEQEPSAGLLSQWTKNMSHFFFSTASSLEQEARRGGIVMIKRTEENDDRMSETLVLFENGAIECRSYNTIDVMDCTYSKRWQLETHRIAITFFSERFPTFHLAKVVTMAIAYMEKKSFGLAVAYVCTGAGTKPTVKYALLHLIDRRATVPELEWGFVLDYEPLFSETVDPRQYFEVETVSMTHTALYLVWSRHHPIQFVSVRLPDPTQKTMQSTAFAIQGVKGPNTFAFGSRIESVEPSMSNPMISASVSFILMDENQTPNGLVCAAMASNMKSIESSQPSAGDNEQRTKQLVRESRTLAKNQTIETYARLLMKHFDDQETVSTLHIHSQDMANVAQAALVVICEILDAKASSGLRWGKDADQESRQDHALSTMVVTPKLVRYQLEEKRARYEAFVTYLQQHCRELWQVITKEYARYVEESEEKLYAAIALCKFQATILTCDEQLEESSRLERKLSGALLLRAMEQTVAARGYEKEQLRLAGYNAFDMFYCELSKVDELFLLLGREVDVLSRTNGEENDMFLYGLLESGYSMQSLLHKRATSGSSWMFTRPVREALVAHIAKLSSTCGYAVHTVTNTIKWIPEQVFELCDQIRALGVVLLDAYTRLIATSETVEEWMKEAEITKRLVLNVYVYIATCYQPQGKIEKENGWQQEQQQEYKRRQHDMFMNAIQLAEQYKYYDAMVYLAFKEDEENLANYDYITGRVAKSAAARRIETYCHVHDDFSEFLFRWYGGEAHVYPWPFVGHVAQSQMFAFLFTNASVYGPGLHTYLKNHVSLHRYCWLTAVSSEKYDHVSTLTLEKAREEKESCEIRKSMASIAKIAALSESTTPQSMVAQATCELAVAKIQDVLTQLPLDLKIKREPLDVLTLIEKSLEALSLVAEDDPLRTSLFLMAIEGLECLPDNVSRAVWEEKCVGVWQACILSDELVWVDLLAEYDAGVNEQKVEELMRSTLLYKSMVEYVGQFKHRGNHRAGLTVEMIDNIVQRQLSTESIISVSTRQLFVKTLNLALAP